MGISRFPRKRLSKYSSQLRTGVGHSDGMLLSGAQVLSRTACGNWGRSSVFLNMDLVPEAICFHLAVLSCSLAREAGYQTLIRVRPQSIFGKGKQQMSNFLG